MTILTELFHCLSQPLQANVTRVLWSGAAASCQFTVHSLSCHQHCTAWDNECHKTKHKKRYFFVTLHETERSPDTIYTRTPG